MANSYYTAADVLKFEKADGLGLGVVIADLLNSAPAVKTLPMIAWEGTQYDYIRQTTDSGAGFRAANDGIFTTAAGFTLVEKTMVYLDATFDLDLQLFQAKPNLYGRLAAASVAAAFFKAEQAFLMGTSKFTNDMATAVDAVDDTLAFDAGGSTASVQTTAFLVYASPTDGYAMVAGNDGILSVSEPFKVSLEGSSEGEFTAIRTNIGGWLAAQLSTYSLGRIFNIDTTDMASTSAFTDADIAAAIAKFPAGKRPNFIIMNTNAQSLLRNSRTATNITGQPAPFPEAAFNADLIITDGIGSTLEVVS